MLPPMRGKTAADFGVTAAAPATSAEPSARASSVGVGCFSSQPMSDADTIPSATMHDFISPPL
jgi:hypothetical protein